MIKKLVIPVLIIAYGLILTLTQGCSLGLQSKWVSIGNAVEIQSGSSDLEITASKDQALDVEVNLAEITDGGTATINATNAHSIIDKGTHDNLKMTGGKSIERSFRGGYEKEDATANSNADHFSESSYSIGGGTVHDLVKGRGVNADRANVPALAKRENKNQVLVAPTETTD